METKTRISVGSLKVHPRNQEFFDDIEGNDYDRFRDSIARNGGVHTPLIISPDMTVVSGHQRLKACIEIGIDKVDVIIRDDLNTEEDKLKVLLETNFMRQKNDQTKQVKVVSEYVGLVGMKHGRPNKSGESRHFTQKEIAESLGISERVLRELLDIDRKLIPEIRELFDKGSVTKYTANKVWCKLSPEEQENFLNEIGKDKIAKMTQKQTQDCINELKYKKQMLEEEYEEKFQAEKKKLEQELAKEKQKLENELEKVKDSLEKKSQQVQMLLKMLVE